MDEYDGLLAAMPASVIGGAVAGWLAAVPFGFGFVTGFLIAAILVFISLFVTPPVE